MAAAILSTRLLILTCATYLRDAVRACDRPGLLAAGAVALALSMVFGSSLRSVKD